MTDAGLNLIPEAELNQHRIAPTVLRKGKPERVNIAGPLCVYEDIIRYGIEMPQIKEGDILAILDVGAYSISLSWQFIKLRGGVCLLCDGKHEMIRRPETVEDVDLVLCVRQPEEILIGTCPSTLGAKVERYEQRIMVRLVEASSGRELKSGEISDAPPECRQSRFEFATRIKAAIEFGAVRTWVEQALAGQGSVPLPVLEQIVDEYIRKGDGP